MIIKNIKIIKKNYKMVIIFFLIFALIIILFLFKRYSGFSVGAPPRSGKGRGGRGKVAVNRYVAQQREILARNGQRVNQMLPNVEGEFVRVGHARPVSPELGTHVINHARAGSAPRSPNVNLNNSVNSVNNSAPVAVKNLTRAGSADQLGGGRSPSSNTLSPTSSGNSYSSRNSYSSGNSSLSSLSNSSTSSKTLGIRVVNRSIKNLNNSEAEPLPPRDDLSEDGRSEPGPLPPRSEDEFSDDGDSPRTARSSRALDLSTLTLQGDGPLGMNAFLREQAISVNRPTTSRLAQLFLSCIPGMGGCKHGGDEEDNYDDNDTPPLRREQLLRANSQQSQVGGRYTVREPPSGAPAPVRLGGGYAGRESPSGAPAPVNIEDVDLSLDVGGYNASTIFQDKQVTIPGTVGYNAQNK